MTNSKVFSELNDLRSSIDNIDTAIVALLAERFHCTDKVGRLKATYRLTPTDHQREEKQFKRLREIATKRKLNPDLCTKLFRYIIDEAVKHHKRIASSMKSDDAHS